MSATYEGNLTVKNGLNSALYGNGTITAEGYLKFRGEGTSDTFITLSSTQTTSKFISFPVIANASDSIVLTTSSDSLINKTITSSTNTVYAKGFKTSSDTTLILNTSTPTSANQVLTYNGTNNLIWQTTGGSIAGTTGQIQYNSSGTLAASINLNIDSSDNYVIIQGVTSDLVTAPTVITNGVKLYGLNRAGRTMLNQIDRNLNPSELQISMYSKKIGLWYGNGSSTTPDTINFDNTITGTASAPALSAGTITMLKVVRYTTSASTNAKAGTRSGILTFISGSSIYNGYFYAVRFYLDAMASTMSSFIGVIGAIAGIGNVDPSTLSNIICFGKDVADTNWQFMYNGTAGATKVDTGYAITANILYEMRIYVPGNSTTVYYSITDVFGKTTLSSSITGTLGTTLPASTQLMATHTTINTRAGTAALGIDIETQYTETYA